MSVGGGVHPACVRCVEALVPHLSQCLNEVGVPAGEGGRECFRLANDESFSEGFTILHL